MPQASNQPDPVAALRRLVKITRSDTGQAAKVANFLLAWWNAPSCGGFDLTELWALDRAIVRDMLLIFALIANERSYPDAYVARDEIEQIVADWRPHLVPIGEE